MSFKQIEEMIFNNKQIHANFKIKYINSVFSDYFDDIKEVYSEYAIQMEHSYSRDCKPIEGANGLTTRTLMVHRPPQCPSCHIHPIDEGIDLDEANHPPIPSYNDSAAKESMNECSRIANSVQNIHQDDQDWEENVNRNGWSQIQERLFSRVGRILDLDHLARLAMIGRQHEPVQRRVTIDKSVQRMRQALASVSWESRLTQWIHGLLMDHLPPSYMASYLDILQTLKTKLPTLMDKMLFGKPMNINQELLTPVMKKQWDPIVSQKNRKLSTNAVFVIIPSGTSNGNIPSRIQKWYQLLSTISPIAQVNINCTGNTLNKQPIDQLAEHIVSISRIKIQDLRSEQPSRHIILVGFNAGASLALQIGLAENVNSVVCMGFAYNTVNGVRGTPDDRILDLTTPVMFIIGQNSARTSQEEIESLREKMQAESSLVVVGSADDVLRVPKNKRQVEGITQSMVDNMVTDEIYEFVRNCIINPPGPRIPTNTIVANAHNVITQARRIGGTMGNSGTVIVRKRKLSQSTDTDGVPLKTKYTPNRQGSMGRPRTRPISNTSKQQLLSQPSTEVLNMAIQSILPETDKVNPKVEIEDEGQIMSTYEIITQPKLEIRPTSGVHQTFTNVNGGQVVLPTIQRTGQISQATATQKIKMIPSNQFVQLKPPGPNAQKIYTIKTPMVGNTSNSGTSGILTDNLQRTQNQIFTVKATSGGTTQFLSTNVTQNQLVLNPQKFTVLKSGTTTIVGSASSSSSGDIAKNSTADLSSTNIFDMPIIFADNDGNIHDTAPLSNTTNQIVRSTPSQIIFTQQSQVNELNQQRTLSTVGGNKNFIFTNAIQQQNKPKTTNKVVFINRNTMKPCSNIISKSIPPLKYTKVVVTNPKTSTPSLVARPTGPIDHDKTMTTITIQKPTISTGTIVKTTQCNSAIAGSSGILQQTSGILNNLSGTATIGNKQFQPIIINVDSDKTTIKNMIKVGDSQLKPTILLKAGCGGLKQIPVLKPGILNRNLTVRKVNLVQGKSTNIVNTTGLSQMIAAVTAGNTGDNIKNMITNSGNHQIVTVQAPISTVVQQQRTPTTTGNDSDNN